ncbi:MAG: hypothetical protein Q4E74_05860 [Ruminococcus sp.]|nr:hypothetical protein [Ruminococcus sp.]
MLLAGVKEDKGWLFSEWRMTYGVGWDKICKAAVALYDTYTDTEILIDNTAQLIRTKQDILKLDESGTLMIRGLSTVIKVPLMITFVNQTNIVKAVVAMATEEFSQADYQKFNLSMCQLMDSIELAMYR